MTTIKHQEASVQQTEFQTPTLGEYAHQVIAEHYQAIVQLDQKVLADKDPEHLHHMRVGTRRLRTALQVFGPVVELPRAARANRVSKLGKTLGHLRDLDVQIADLNDRYRPRLGEAGQEMIDSVIAQLRRKRRKAFAATEDALTRSHYRSLKSAYDAWLSEPRYTVLAQLPLTLVLPDLLSPLLSSLLLHPGWLVQSPDLSPGNDEMLHDLRKACKHARYQAEFFQPFYQKSFQTWIGEVKQIQAALGSLHDAQVLSGLLAELLADQMRHSDLQDAIYQTQRESMADWETTRQKYLGASYRQHLHQLVLSPTGFDR